MAKKPAVLKPPEAPAEIIQAVQINKFKINIPEFKNRLEFIESWYNSAPEKQQQRQERTKQLLKNLTESILSKHYNDFDKAKYDLILRVVDDWYNKDVSHQLNIIKGLLSEIKQQKLEPESKRNITVTGEEKIFSVLKWNKEKSPYLLIDILEKLNYLDEIKIDFNEIDKILSLDEFLVFTERTNGKPRNLDLLCLFKALEECNFINELSDKKKFIDRIVFTFIPEGKECRDLNNDSFNTEYSKKGQKFKENPKIKHYKSHLNKLK